MNIAPLGSLSKSISNTHTNQLYAGALSHIYMMGLANAYFNFVCQQAKHERATKKITLKWKTRAYLMKYITEGSNVHNSNKCIPCMVVLVVLQMVASANVHDVELCTESQDAWPKSLLCRFAYVRSVHYNTGEEIHGISIYWNAESETDCTVDAMWTPVPSNWLKMEINTQFTAYRILIFIKCQ